MLHVLATIGETKNGILSFTGTWEVKRTARRVAQILNFTEPLLGRVLQFFETGSAWETSQTYRGILNQCGLVYSHTVQTDSTSPSNPETIGRPRRQDVMHPKTLAETIRQSDSPIIAVVGHKLAVEVIRHFAPKATINGSLTSGSAIIFTTNGDLMIVPSAPFIFDRSLYLDPFRNTVVMTTP